MPKDAHRSKKRRAAVIRVDPSHLDPEAVRKAATVLSAGGIVAFPTESFYGLGVDATRDTAIRRLFQIKGRPASQPLLILIPSVDMLTQYVQGIPRLAQKLIDAFWPGGLTLVFGAGPGVSHLLTAGTGRIGVRLSSHPVAAALAQTLGRPISGTSANISGAPPCNTAEAVMMSLGSRIDLILDGGTTSGITGSTVLDVTTDPPEILREGMVDRNRLRSFVPSL